jgi:hypothetical protein
LNLYFEISFDHDRVNETSPLKHPFGTIISQIGAFLSTLNSIFPVARLPSSSVIFTSHRHVHSTQSFAVTDKIPLSNVPFTNEHETICHINLSVPQAHSVACNNVITFHISLVHDNTHHTTYGDTRVTQVSINSYVAVFCEIFSFASFTYHVTITNHVIGE